jgi:glycine cleavage system H protein
MMDHPNDRRYDALHSWVRKEPDDTYSVGITKPSAEANEEFVFIQLPDVGAQLATGDTYVTLESVKSTGHVASPIAGEVLEVNEALFDDPALINQDPYGSWIMRIRIDDPAQYDALEETPGV